jgi:hypothetical protein
VRLFRRKPSPRPAASPQQWLDQMRQSGLYDAESLIVFEVMANRAYPSPNGGWAVREDDELYAEVDATLRYWRTGGRG